MMRRLRQPEVMWLDSSVAGFGSDLLDSRTGIRTTFIKFPRVWVFIVTLKKLLLPTFPQDFYLLGRPLSNYHCTWGKWGRERIREKKWEREGGEEEGERERERGEEGNACLSRQEAVRKTTHLWQVGRKSSAESVTSFPSPVWADSSPC